MVKEVKEDTPTDANNTVSASGSIEILHFDNFVKTIRGDAKLNSPVDEAAKSVLLCHLANIAQRTGETLICDPKNGHITNSKEGMKLWGRSYEKGWEPKV